MIIDLGSEQVRSNEIHAVIWDNKYIPVDIHGGTHFCFPVNFPDLSACGTIRSLFVLEKTR